MYSIIKMDEKMTFFRERSALWGLEDNDNATQKLKLISSLSILGIQDGNLLSSRHAEVPYVRGGG